MSEEQKICPLKDGERLGVLNHDSVRGATIDDIRKLLPEGYALVSADCVQISLSALKFWVMWMKRNSWNDPEPIEHHYAIGAIDEIESMIAEAKEASVACCLCEGSGKKVVGPDQDGRKYKIDCDCTKS